MVILLLSFDGILIKGRVANLWGPIDNLDGGFQRYKLNHPLSCDGSYNYIAIHKVQIVDDMKRKEYQYKFITKDEIFESLGDIYTAEFWRAFGGSPVTGAVYLLQGLCGWW